MTAFDAELEQAITAKLESLYSNSAFYDDAAAARAVLDLLYERGIIKPAPEPEPFRIEDTCCGKCTMYCYVDQITGA